jgi:hypothetical protein|tara:strand:- start:204 stop:356 length:153 start_codon:yes stop_codon:yes gene_type:complete
MRCDFNQTQMDVIMSQEETNYDDSKADAWMALATIAIVVATVVYWLSGQG